MFLVMFNSQLSINKFYFGFSVKSVRVIFCFIFPIFVSLKANAIDVVSVNVGESPNDTRVVFKNELVRHALEITKDKYGDYEIVENPQRMNIARAFRELQKGENLSLTFAHTRPEFEEKAFPIRVSLRQGIDSYRLLLVRKGEKARFRSVKTTEDLKAFTVGLSPNWSTYKVMNRREFKIVDAPDYASMFRMLDLKRFDFIPRAINEIYDEIDLYEPVGEGLEIVDGIALYIPAASYMFVSRKQPRIFERLNSGLHAMNVNGDLSVLTEKYYRKSVLRAKLQDRIIISMDDSKLANNADSNELTYQ